jgi:hypothetical protein
MSARDKVVGRPADAAPVSAASQSRTAAIGKLANTNVMSVRSIPLQRQYTAGPAGGEANGMHLEPLSASPHASGACQQRQA